MPRPRISVIIPTRKRDTALEQHLAPLRQDPDIEIIVVTPQMVGRANRAVQMNHGARQASGELLVFLHGDTVVHPEDLTDMASCLEQDSDLIGGAFRFSLDADSWRATLIEWGVVLRELVFQLPYGDQALFIRRQSFETIGGYPEVPLLEDVLLVRAMKKQGQLLYHPAPAITSALRWEEHGYLKATLVNWGIMLLWRCGFSLQRLKKIRESQLGIS